MLFGTSSPLVGTDLLGTLILLYTDPGTGTLILQLLAAGLIGAAFYARQFARRAKSLFSKKDAGEDAPAAEAGEVGESSSDLAKKSK
ncbi:MAG TPA: hypothetical protein VD861_18555 [Pyrinomonadaceae bacterium]|jgi:hypothetical protein|nr:hypothetical protein [Pyrinomonadaceae bacterium]